MEKVNGRVVLVISYERLWLWYVRTTKNLSGLDFYPIHRLFVFGIAMYAWKSLAKKEVAPAPQRSNNRIAKALEREKTNTCLASTL